MSEQPFVPADFAIPDGLTAGSFRLEPLGPQHNAADYAAWTGSADHILATPGFAGTGWPHEMSLADNLRDLERHAQDFAERGGFTYTVLGSDTGDVIGCVYIYPLRDEPPAGAAAARGRPEGTRHVLGARGPFRARCRALPHRPGLARARLAVRLDRVRVTTLTRVRGAQRNVRTAARTPAANVSQGTS